MAEAEGVQLSQLSVCGCQGTRVGGTAPGVVGVLYDLEAGVVNQRDDVALEVVEEGEGRGAGGAVGLEGGHRGPGGGVVVEVEVVDLVDAGGVLGRRKINREKESLRREF